MPARSHGPDATAPTAQRGPAGGGASRCPRLPRPLDTCPACRMRTERPTRRCAFWASPAAPCWSLGPTHTGRIVQGPLAQRCGRQTPHRRFVVQLAVLAESWKTGLARSRSARTSHNARRRTGQTPRSRNGADNTAHGTRKEERLQCIKLLVANLRGRRERALARSSLLPLSRAAVPGIMPESGLRKPARPRRSRIHALTVSPRRVKFTFANYEPARWFQS